MSWSSVPVRPASPPPALPARSLPRAWSTTIRLPEDRSGGAGYRLRDRLAARWLQRFQQAKVTRIHGAQVVARLEPGVLLAERDGQPVELRYEKLILATGAREQFLPFPGWTLPNVVGAGGLQALVKSGMPIRRQAA